MAEDLPSFRYHPDPVETGSVAPSEAACLCCGRARGFIYVGPVYAERELGEQLCPWCIANGAAAAKFDASFVDGDDLAEADIDEEIVEEVRTRTPGYIGWQQEAWLSHCEDACEYHGPAAAVDLERVDRVTRAEWKRQYGLGEKDWSRVTRDYEPGGDMGFYKFRCRRCDAKLLAWDCS